METLGGAVDDPRLKTRPAYASGRNRSASSLDSIYNETGIVPAASIERDVKDGVRFILDDS